MKIGRNLAKARAALRSACLTRAIYVERGTMEDEIVLPLPKRRRRRALFLDGARRPATAGGRERGPPRVARTWSGPRALDDARGRRRDRPRERCRRLCALSRSAFARAQQRRHSSDNRVEIDRARLRWAWRPRAPSRACFGRRSWNFRDGGGRVRGGRGGRAGVARAGHRSPPGLRAMQAAAARLGAPLGHDFCAISLSDNLKPWDVIARRLVARRTAISSSLCTIPPRRRGQAHPRSFRPAAATQDRRDAGRLRARRRPSGRESDADDSARPIPASPI